MVTQRPIRAAILCLSLIVISAAAVAQDAPPKTASVSFHSAGSEVSLAAGSAERLSLSTQTAISRCALNSAEGPEMFRDKEANALWDETFNNPSRLFLRFAAAFDNRSWSSKKIPISEVLISFDNDYFVGPVLSRHDGTVVAFFKCFGDDMLEIMCTPELAPYLRDGQKRNCRIPRHRLE
jgi:hypothetical protein